MCSWSGIMQSLLNLLGEEYRVTMAQMHVSDGERA